MEGGVGAYPSIIGRRPGHPGQVTDEKLICVSTWRWSARGPFPGVHPHGVLVQNSPPPPHSLPGLIPLSPKE